MDKKISLITGMALLFAGIAQAETPATPEYVDPGYVNGGHFAALTESKSEPGDKDIHKEAAAPAATRTVSVENTTAEQELHPEALPFYNDGGHWGR